MHNIRLPKQSTVGDVIHELSKKVISIAVYTYTFNCVKRADVLCILKVELSNPQAELRILEVFHNKIYKVTIVSTVKSLLLFILFGVAEQCFLKCRYFH